MFTLQWYVLFVNSRPRQERSRRFRLRCGWRVVDGSRWCILPRKLGEILTPNKSAEFWPWNRPWWPSRSDPLATTRQGSTNTSSCADKARDHSRRLNAQVCALGAGMDNVCSDSIPSDQQRCAERHALLRACWFIREPALLHREWSHMGERASSTDEPC